MEVLVEHVAHDLDQQIGFAVQQSGSLGGLDDLADRRPLRGEAVHVERELLIGGTLGRSAHDDTRIVGEHLFENLLESRPLGVRELAADAIHRPVGNVDEIPARQRDLARETGSLVPDWVLGDLHEHLVARLQRELDAARLALALGRILRGRFPVDLARVQHGVAPTSDVDEGSLHARKHVLHLAEVDVADEARLLRLSDIVLDEHAVLENGDLNAACFRSNDHRAVDALTSGEKLRLGDDGATTTGVAPIATALLLCLETGRAAHSLRLVARLGLSARCTHLDDGVGRGAAALAVTVLLPGSTACPATHRGRLVGQVVVVAVLPALAWLETRKVGGLKEK